MVTPLLLLNAILLGTLCTNVTSGTSDGPRYFHIPTLEIMQSEVYLTQTEHQETVIAYSSKGSDLHPGDYVTHADGIRLLNGGLTTFLKNGDGEAVVPVIDEDSAKHGGHILLGFVLIQVVTPRKLSTRRGDIVFDLEEGGPAPTVKLGNLVMGPGGVKSTTDPSYQPPPYGGGACITGKDCFYFNGTCAAGRCSCLGPYTGTFCQLNRPEHAAASIMLKKTQQKLEQQSGTSNSNAGGSGGVRASASNVDAFTPKPGAAMSSVPRKHAEGETQQQSEEQQEAAEEPKRVLKKKKKPSPKKKPHDASEAPPVLHDWAIDNDTHRAPVPVAASGAGGREEQSLEATSQPANAATLEDLYGADKAYPEPYVAGRLPANVQQERHRRRSAREVFLYSVRYRSGPLGLVFDNKQSNATLVEQVVKGQQSELSDVKEGDLLLAVDTFNVSAAPAKVTQRVLSSLPWPRILVFQTRYAGEDPSLVQKKIQSRSFNASIIFPPTLVGDLSFRLAEWTSAAALQPEEQELGSSCPIYRVRAAQGDLFGCRVQADEYRLPEEFGSMAKQSGYVGAEEEQASPFLALLLQEAKSRDVELDVRSLAVMKRGMCTFVEKSKAMQKAGAQLGLVVNSDNDLLDMPAGKENTQDCSASLGLVRAQDGDFLHLAARTNEVWLVVSASQSAGKNSGELSAACQRVVHMVEDLVDKWPHTVPPLSVQQIKSNKAPDQTKIRGLTEEGGRVALSGENGWVFLDYHLAMFGPQEVPLGPHRLVMAMPPFGCDPAAYSVRISDAIVAILRGGGCSFGIKVINAQRLGAKAVIIVNTDDLKTMRLMALPDEIPLITIPCIMVSRRIQFYVEQLLRPYYPVSQHLVSIQPTGVFGDYEQRNSLQLPVRLSAS
jgi:hypothetical protein